MKEQLISFETAKLAKEKGFEMETYRWYYSINGLNGKVGSSTMGMSYLKNHSKRGKLYYSAPTQSLLQKYLREKEHLYVVVQLELQYTREIDQDGKNPHYVPEGWYYSINDDAYSRGGSGKVFNTYEEALEDGLKETLKLIKKPK